MQFRHPLLAGGMNSGLTKAAVAFARGGFRVKCMAEPLNVLVEMTLELEGTGVREATFAV